MTEGKDEKSLDKLTPRELKREIGDLLQQIDMKDKEIIRLKAMVDKLMEGERNREEIIDIRKRADEALKNALDEAEMIIKTAKTTAGRIIDRAKALKASIEKGQKEPELVLPGSRELVISDDILKGGSGRESLKEPQIKTGRVFEEYFGEKKKADAAEEISSGGGWRDIIDSLHKK